MSGKLDYKVGNLFDNIPNDENIIIAHIVNNYGKMGAGFVIPLMKQFPNLKSQYKFFSDVYTTETLLGRVYYYQGEEDYRIVANMFAQDGLGDRDRLHPLSYDALETCMLDVRNLAMTNGARIVAPKFGAGLSGGSWLIIEAMIKEFWKELDVTIYVLDSSELPNSW